jgi:hypothetical protein
MSWSKLQEVKVYLLAVAVKMHGPCVWVLDFLQIRRGLLAAPPIQWGTAVALGGV